MMREIIPADELLNKACVVGQYYGFVPLVSLTVKKRGEPRAKPGLPEALASLALDPIAETVASFLKQFQNTQSAPTPRQPLFVWHTNIAPGRPAQKKATVQFHAFGTDRPLADTLIIRALIALTRDLYHEEPIVRINSMGDKETRARYSRELGNFFKKRANNLPEECVTQAKCDAFAAAELAISRECAEDLPAPTEHLSDASRKRFEDLLEYLEMTETPYELARNLISRGSVWNDTCFEILANGRRVAWGSRYNDLARHFFPGAPFSATGAVFQVASEGMAVAKAKPSRLRFSFVHIGDEAKRLSIKLADDFRKARVSLAQDIGVESLTEQIALAERRDSPYLLIIGRKEALEGSAILRNRKTQEQTILPLLGLAERLKSFA
ncbi:MAG: His/Gly/Thr/Pro-type tRNA ligase C-terminal domain-containing protein [bacterium]|nr:His/Gly/Thr/Pro-type tRNA ligase C-terminal domain-containing protein [bacterium]